VHNGKVLRTGGSRVGNHHSSTARPVKKREEKRKGREKVGKKEEKEKEQGNMIGEWTDGMAGSALVLPR